LLQSPEDQSEPTVAWPDRPGNHFARLFLDFDFARSMALAPPSNSFGNDDVCADNE
jgi:hypothetical protein